MLEISSVSFSYPGQPCPAISGASLTVREGEILSVIGRNASGKSTLAGLAAGILKPQSGSVTVDGLDTGTERLEREVRKKIAFLQQNPESQFVSVTVEREIASGPENLGIEPSETRAIVEEMLEFFALGKLRKNPPHALSSGQMQKVLLASLLAMRPSYLILDEPTSYLDPLERAGVGRELRRISNSLGASVVWVTQFLNEAFYSPRIVGVHGGRLCFDGAPGELAEDKEALALLGIRDIPDVTESRRRVSETSHCGDTATEKGSGACN